ncbi:MAG: hypothetical protein LBV17_01330 [Treponema sp.]|jgi:hypothetical protein|nr:hypothetical protein [Treponema sp.]
MALFTERHGMRKQIERTSIITVEMYSLLFDCCVKYYDNLTCCFPAQCPDGLGYYGIDLEKFNISLKFDIPNLYRNKYNGNVEKPVSSSYSSAPVEYDQYALLDFIEFIAQNCRDYKYTENDYHSYFMHHHFTLLNTCKCFEEFRIEINNIFEKTGLLFTLTKDKIIERVLENSVATDEVIAAIKDVREQGTKELLEEAIYLFKRPNPSNKSAAVEKIWDAFERLKTYYTSLDKKASTEQIVNDMGNYQIVFTKLFDDEFRCLTTIGNTYRIRHHETDKINIEDDHHFDYFFNRCLSLISLAINYLK